MTGVFNVKKSAIWHAIAPIYGASTVIIMDMLPWTAQIRYHHQAHQHAAEVTPLTGMIDPPLGIIATPDVLTMITRIGPGLDVPDPAHITMEIRLAAVMTSIGAAPGHSTDLPDVVSHTTEAQVPITITMPHCTADLHPVGIIPKMTADLITNPKNNITSQHKDPCQTHKQHLGSIKIEDTNRSQLMIHCLNTTVPRIMLVRIWGWFKLNGPSPTSHVQEGYPMMTPSHCPHHKLPYNHHTCRKALPSTNRLQCHFLTSLILNLQTNWRLLQNTHTTHGS